MKGEIKKGDTYISETGLSLNQFIELKDKTKMFNYLRCHVYMGLYLPFIDL